MAIPYLFYVAAEWCAEAENSFTLDEVARLGSFFGDQSNKFKKEDKDQVWTWVKSTADKAYDSLDEVHVQFELQKCSHYRLFLMTQYPDVFQKPLGPLQRSPF